MNSCSRLESLQRQFHCLLEKASTLAIEERRFYYEIYDQFTYEELLVVKKSIERQEMLLLRQKKQLQAA